MPGPGRALIWIEGEAGRCRRCALARLAALPAAAIGWVGGVPPADARPAPAGVMHHVPGGQGRALLGRTLLAGVLDAHAGLDPDDLGALAGTIGGGGYCLLLTPPAGDWPRAADPALERLLSEGVAADQAGSVFIERWIRQLSAATAVHRQPADHPLTPLPAPLAGAGATAPGAGPATNEQQHLVDAIVSLARSDAPGTILVTADRGRGKSAALGLAARALGDASAVRVTAASRAAATTTLAWAGAGAAQFIAPEAVRPAPSLLLIDEAAALPLGQLDALIEANPRCVVTGTVHGYEGSGRGLILRLARRLAGRSRALQSIRLTTPVRWAPDDPLEALVNGLLRLDAEPRAAVSGPAPRVRVEALSRRQLARHEADLTATFGLLVAGHYRTRPRDLRQLLDDPSMQIWLARHGEAILGVLAARIEGGLEARLSDAIHTGRRRPSGHLIAQSLTFHAGIASAATRRGLRIQRIAVEADHRRTGIGRQLLDAARQRARRDGLDWLGVSFGMDAEVLDFWMACGLQPVRLGNRLDARSGTPALIMLEGLSGSGKALQAQARERLAVHLPDQLRAHRTGIDPACRARLQRGLPETPDVRGIDAADLAAFAHGHRPLLDARGALARWAEDHAGRLGRTDRALLAAALDGPRDAAAMARAAGLAGRRAALARLRELLAANLRSDDE